MAENTFLGLQPYTEDDAYRFKGRTEESLELFRLIVRNDFTVCYAESGEGKTSLLNAGVFPLLRQNMYFPVTITFTNDDYQVTPDNFSTIIDRCIKDSITEYNEKNKGVRVEYKLCSTDFQGLDCQAELQQELNKYSWWKLRNYKPQAMGLTFTPVFIFDQFEEVFNMPGSIVWTKKFFDWLEDVSSDSCPDEITKKIRAIIGTNAAFPSIKEEKDFKAVFSLRKEFIGELDYWGMQKCFIPSLKDNRYCLKALTYEGAKKVMTQQERFDEEKVEQILTHFVSQYSREPEKTIKEQLPIIPALLLSVVCDSWEKDISSFAKLSTEEISQSLNKVLEKFYDDTIDAVIKELNHQNASPSDLDSIRKDIDVAMFDLVDVNGKRVRVKAVTTLGTISMETDRRFSETLPIVKYKEILNQHRIVKITKIDGEDYVEIVHDSLCPIIAKRREMRLAEEAKEREEKRIAKVKSKYERRNYYFKNIIIFFIVIILGFIVFDGYVTRNQKSVPSLLKGEMLRDEALTFIPDTLRLEKCFTYKNAFRGNPYIKVLFIGDSTIVNTQAFSNCRQLEEVHLDGKNIVLWSGAFANCPNLQTVFISDTCSIDSMRFQYGMHSLNRVIIDNNPYFKTFGHTLVITDNSGYSNIIDKNITSDLNSTRNIVLPYNFLSSHLVDHVTLRLSLFCTEGKTVNIDTVHETNDYNPYSHSTYFKIWNEDVIEEPVFLVGDLEKIPLNSTIPYSKVIDISLPNLLTIDNYLFDGSNVETMYLPSLRDIGIRSFAYSELNHVYLPSVENVSDSAFYNCQKNKNAWLPSALLIGDYAFSNNPIEHIFFPKVEYVGKYAFSNCHELTYISLPNAKVIGEKAFYNCKNISTIKLDNATEIGANAFLNCFLLDSLIVPFEFSKIIVRDPSYYGLSSFFKISKTNGNSSTLCREPASVCANDSVFDFLSIEQSARGIHVGKNVKIFSNEWIYKYLKRLEIIDVAISNPYYFSWRGCLLQEKEGKSFLVSFPINAERIFIPTSGSDSLITLGDNVQKVILLEPTMIWNLVPSPNSKIRPTIYIPHNNSNFCGDFADKEKYGDVVEMGLIETIYYKTSFANTRFLHICVEKYGINLVMGILIFIFVLCPVSVLLFVKKHTSYSLVKILFSAIFFYTLLSIIWLFVLVDNQFYVKEISAILTLVYTIIVFGIFKMSTRILKYLFSLGLQIYLKLLLPFASTVWVISFIDLHESLINSFPITYISGFMIILPLLFVFPWTLYDKITRKKRKVEYDITTTIKKYFYMELLFLFYEIICLLLCSLYSLVGLNYHSMLIVATTCISIACTYHLSKSFFCSGHH